MKSGFITLLLAASLLVSHPAAAAKEVSIEDARAFVAEFGDQTVGVLTSSSMSADERATELGRVLVPVVNFEQIARFVLGRSGRGKKGSGFQAFTRAFAAHVIDLAAEKFAELSVQGYSISRARKMPDGDVIVTTMINHSSGEPFRAGWRVRNRDGELKINDVLVEGYSIAIHFRESFERSVVGGMANLTKKLRSETEGTPAAKIVNEMMAEK